MQPRFKAIATARGDHDNLQVILLGSDGYPYLLWQAHADGGWHWYGKLPNPNGVRFSTIATGIGDDQNVQVVGIGAYDNLPYLIWQGHSDGLWFWYGPLPNPKGYQLRALAPGTYLNQQADVGKRDLWMPAIGATDGLVYAMHLYGWGDVPSYWDGVSGFNNGSAGIYMGAITSFTFPADYDRIPGAYVFLLGAADRMPYVTEMDYKVNGCGSPGEGVWDCWLWYYHGPLPDPGVPFSTFAAGEGSGLKPLLVGLGAKDGFPYLIFQENNGVDWNWWGALPNPSGIAFRALALGKGNDQNEQVILLGANDGGIPYLIWQSHSAGDFHWNGGLPNPSNLGFSSVATGNGDHDRLQVILLGATDGLPYLIWQSDATQGNWFWYGKLPSQ